MLTRLTLDRYAARCVSSVTVVTRRAVRGARSAPRDTVDQPALPLISRQTRWLVGVLVAALLVAPPRVAGQGSIALDAAFSAFWRASDPMSAAAAARQVLASGTDFATILQRLKAGRPYAFGRVDDLTTAPTFFAPAATISRARRDIRGLWHPYLVMVPPSYNPSKRYPVRLYLQGDTTRPASSAESGAGWPDYSALAREDAIVVFPGAWNGFAWWDASQVEQMAAVLDELKRSYNVDENRVYLLGSSDGGTGIYYHAMVAPTLWAGYLPFNGDPSVLADPQAAVDTQLYAANLAGQALYVVHGGRDQIFPAAGVAAWLGLFESAGARLDFQIKKDYGHETRWWSDEEPSMDRFMADHSRNPLPDKVIWETAQADRSNRAWWVVIDELGAAADQTAEIGPNAVMSTAPGIGVGIWRDVTGRGVQVGLIQPESPAAVAGLQEGDLIEQVGSTPAPAFAALEAALHAAAGSSLSLTVSRDGQRRTLSMAIPPNPAGVPVEAFPHPRPSGRVEVDRKGNSIDLKTRGVRRVTLLLSPERFDFSRPISVVANGTTAFEGMLTPSAGVLMKWAVRDNDRTMLFAQELEIRLP